MTGPLLVPMRLDALLVNDEGRWGTKFRRWTPTFHHLDRNISPEPEAFTNNDAADWASNPAAGGVYLQWQLPSALRNGVHDAASGRTDFVKIPNRWLVLRLAGARTWTGWVVESDHRHTAMTEGSPFTDKAGTGGGRIGRRIPLEDFTERGREDDPWLDALGPGLLTFSTYQPYNNDVLSVHDDLHGIGDTADLSYLVVGWYANPGRDVILREGGVPQWIGAQGAAPTRTLLVAHALNLPWKRSGPAPESDRPAKTGDVHIAVGNGSVDALGALLGAVGMDLDDVGLLETLQHGLLDRLDEDGHPAADRAVHASWFATGHGGWHWQAVDKPGVPASRTGRTTPAERAMLGRLNRAQAAHDAVVRELAAERWKLYAAWWLCRTPGLTGPYPGGLHEFLAGERVGELLEDLARRRNPRGPGPDSVPWGATPAELTEAATAYPRPGELSATRVLRRAPLPDFRSAADPVVMLTGLNAPPQDDPGAPLTCRGADQVVSRMDGLAASEVPAPPSLARLPETEVLAGLVHEFGLCAVARSHGVDPQKAAVQGVRPLFGLGAWRQPWQPLYLEYELRYYPIAYPGNWTFEGTRYYWNGTGAPDGEEYLTYRGRVFLTPHATFNLKGRLRQYVRTHPSAPSEKLADLADKVGSWDVLSQSLDGLTRQMQLRSPGLGTRPEGPMGALIGDEHRTVPISGGAPPADLDQAPPSDFQQMRAGQFHFNRLTVVDRFGQSCDIVDPGGTGGAANARAKALLTSPGVTPEKTITEWAARTYVELRPRLPQGARLRFEPLAPNGTDCGPHIDPVCGWLLPNHLDDGIAVFDAEGTALGEARRIIGDGSAVITGWDPAPSSPYPTIASLGGKVPHLDALLAGLAQGPSGGITDMLHAVDTSVSAITPRGGFDDLTLTVLAGRPLAIVRARVWFELDGPPLFDPSWRNWQHELGLRPGRPAPAFLGYRFGVRLGAARDQDDCLVGYYRGDDYSALRSAHAQPEQAPSGYVRPQESLPLTLTDHCDLTLLVDPRAPVHAVTDLLPVSSLLLDPELFENRLRRLRISFRIGPLLAGTAFVSTPEDPHTYRAAAAIPRPATRHGVWKWTEPDDGRWTSLPLAPPGRPATTAPEARTGRLYRDAPLD